MKNWCELPEKKTSKQWSLQNEHLHIYRSTPEPGKHPGSFPENIKEQYHFLIQAWHPDKFSNPIQKAKAEEKTKEINEAYSVLKDPKNEQNTMRHFF
jgi:hypothetical protein